FIFSMGLDFHWMAKKEAFVPPFGSILRWLGGIPVDRDAPRGLVQQVIDQFKARDQFVLVITPEGTRKKVARWKSGFYRIAVAADVPIVLGYADYPKRIIGFGPAIYPSGNLEADMEKILAFYAMITPRH